MKNMNIVAGVLAAVASVAVIGNQAKAALAITEVNPAGSSTTYSTTGGGYGADWFELTNTGTSAQTITGYAFRDASTGTPVALNGITSIAAGESVIFMEDSDNTKSSHAANDAALSAAFLSSWFGNTPPANLQIGFYGGSGIGLSSSGDAVNIFTSTTATSTIANVTFGAATAGKTFDNTAGINGAISTVSSSGVNGAFVSSGTSEVGSPGAVPEPASLALLGLGGLATLRRRRAK